MKIKMLGMLGIMLGVFLFAGVAAASTADVLQPAGATTNMESLRVGVAGQGGVTFFNGTVLNEGDDPFTVGDDMRVDGEIYRTEKGGDNPLKISDHVIPTMTETNDFGTEDNRWNDLYAVTGNFSDAVTIQGGTVWTSENDGSGSGLNADKLDGHSTGYFAKSSHSHDSDYLKLSGGTLSGNLTVNGATYFDNNIWQNRAESGIMKALVSCSSDGTLIRSWDANPFANPTCVRNSAGSYTVDFNFKVDDRYFSITPVAGQGSQRFTQMLFSGTDTIYIFSYDETGANADTGFMIQVY